MKHRYKPLPKNVELKISDIDGIGLYAAENIYTHTCLGISHVYNVAFENSYVRTPLGGYINHSEEPNCVLIEVQGNMAIISIKDIKQGDELTLDYRETPCVERDGCEKLQFLDD